ncbi:MAG: hypothetical protein R2941_19585, partial [Desulfobacterales bacterium]
GSVLSWLKNIIQCDNQHIENIIKRSIQWMIFQLFAAKMNHARIMVKEILGILLYAVIMGKKRIADYCIAEPADHVFQNVKELPCSMPGYRMAKLNSY